MRRFVLVVVLLIGYLFCHTCLDVWLSTKHIEHLEQEAAGTPLHTSDPKAYETQANILLAGVFMALGLGVNAFLPKPKKTRGSARIQQARERTGKQKAAFIVGSIFAFLIAWNFVWLIETWNRVKGDVLAEHAMRGGFPYYVEQTKRLFRKPVTFLGVKLNASEKELLEKAPFFDCFAEEGKSPRRRECRSYVAHKTDTSPQSLVGDFVRPSFIFNDSQPYQIISYREPYPEFRARKPGSSTIHLYFIDDKLKLVETTIYGTSIIKEALKQLTAVYGPGKENYIDGTGKKYDDPISVTWNMRGGEIYVRREMRTIHTFEKNAPRYSGESLSLYRWRTSRQHDEPSDHVIRIYFRTDDYFKLRNETLRIEYLNSRKK